MPLMPPSNLSPRRMGATTSASGMSVSKISKSTGTRATSVKRDTGAKYAASSRNTVSSVSRGSRDDNTKIGTSALSSRSAGWSIGGRDEQEDMKRREEARDRMRYRHFQEIRKKRLEEEKKMTKKQIKIEERKRKREEARQARMTNMSRHGSDKD